MRKTTCLLALVLSAGVVGLAQTPAKSSTAAASKLSQAMLVDGTPVKLRVGAGINTASVRVGDELELDVDQEVRINDVVVISTSSVAKVVVTSQGLDAAKTGNAMVGLRYVTLADGEKVALRPTAERKPNAAKTMLVSAGEGDVAIGNGAEVTAYVNGNLPLDLPKLRLANQPTNELKITTTPGNAEVSVDGKVMGSTPFSARVVHGEHVVALRMAGFQAWRGNRARNCRADHSADCAQEAGWNGIRSASQKRSSLVRGSGASGAREEGRGRWAEVSGRAD